MKPANDFLGDRVFVVEQNGVRTRPTADAKQTIRMQKWI
jgi:hypothetical protein